MNKTPSHSGFTIIELSIVLVIIALITGGIITARSMVAAARIHSISKQVKQYDIAINMFKTKFRYYPGDSPTDSFGISVPTGNGDDKILATNEGILAWYQLTATGDVKFECSSYCYNSDYGAMPGVNVPAWDVDKTVGFSIALSLPASKNAIIVGKQSGNLAFTSGGFMEPASVLAIDAKFDDGMANAGNVRTNRIGICVDEDDANNYLLTNEARDCSIDFFLSENN